MEQTLSRVAWDLDEQVLQLEREINYPATREDGMRPGFEATQSRATEWDRGCGSWQYRHYS